MTRFASHRPTFTVGLIAALALSLALPGGAAEKGRQDEPFEDLTEVIEVQVPVNVVSRDGEPVRGLGAEDFVIVDQGDRREVTDLRVVDLEVIGPHEEETIPSAARRHILLLFDLSFSNPSAVVRARQAAQRFVAESLHPTDLAAVATHSVDTGARLVVTFTPDRAQLARAIDTLGAPRLLQAGLRDPLRFVIDDPGNVASLASGDFDRPGVDRGPVSDLAQSVISHLRVVGQYMERSERAFAAGRISSWTQSMGDLARMLDSIKGRKHVVYFSEGFDGQLLLGRRPSAADPDQQIDQLNLQLGNFWMVDTDEIYGNSGLQSEVSTMLDQFRRADCVIQAVDISGLRADAAASERAQSVGQDALFYVANDTGGELYEDANDFGSELEEVLRRSSVTYLLTFQPRGIERDGSYRRLEVKVPDAPRGARVSHRQGYYAPRPFEELHPLERNLLASDAIASAEPREELEVDVLAAPFRATDDLAYVPVIVEVEGRDLLRGQPSDALSVEFYTYVSDGRGEIRDFFTQVVSLDIGRAREEFEATGLKYYGHLDLAPGEYLLRVLVRNAVTGRTGVRAVQLHVPDELSADTLLLPPFFLESPGSWFLVRESQGEGYQRSVVYPFTVNGDPYVPAARPVLEAREEARFCLVAYNLSSAELELAGTVLDGEGKPVEGGGDLDLLERTVTGIDGLDKLLATFRPHPSLAAGEYTLRVAVEDPARGEVGSNSIPFVIPN